MPASTRLGGVKHPSLHTVVICKLTPDSHGKTTCRSSLHHCSPPAADREPTLKIPARIVPGLGLGRNHLKIRPNRLELVQNNLNSLNSSVNLNEFKVVAATAILIYVNTS